MHICPCAIWPPFKIPLVVFGNKLKKVQLEASISWNVICNICQYMSMSTAGKEKLGAPCSLDVFISTDYDAHTVQKGKV